MGNWYANIALRGPSQADTLDALREWRNTAFVSYRSRGYVVIYDEQCRKMDGDDSERLASKLTTRFDCSALIALNADDDVLWLCAYSRGNRTAEYDSSTPARTGARDLCRASGRTMYLPALWCVLQGPFLFAIWRHMAACSVLALPTQLCTIGYPGGDDGRLLGHIPDGLFHATRED